MNNTPAIVKLRRSQTATQTKNNRNGVLNNNKQNTQSEIQTSTSKQGPKKPFSSNSNLSISSDSSHDSNCD